MANDYIYQKLSKHVYDTTSNTSTLPSGWSIIATSSDFGGSGYTVLGLQTQHHRKIKR